MSGRAERRRERRQQAHQRGEDARAGAEATTAPGTTGRRPARRRARRRARQERDSALRAAVLAPFKALGADLDGIQDEHLRAGAWLMVRGVVFLVIGSTMATVAPVDEEWLGLAALLCMAISVVFVGLAVRAAWPWLRRTSE